MNTNLNSNLYIIGRIPVYIKEKKPWSSNQIQSHSTSFRTQQKYNWSTKSKADMPKMNLRDQCISEQLSYWKARKRIHSHCLFQPLLDCPQSVFLSESGRDNEAKRSRPVRSRTGLRRSPNPYRPYHPFAFSLMDKPSSDRKRKERPRAV